MRIDHLLHLLAGAAIAALVALVALLWGAPAWALWGLLAAAAAGVAKEAWDSLGHGTVEASDVFWTAAGAVPVVIIWGIWG